jgi:ligand-binding sensor domain-containing protein
VSGERAPLRWWVPVLAVAALVVAANLAGALVESRTREARIEPTLVIVRPPGEVSTLLLDGGTLYAGGVDGVWAVDTASLEVTRPPFASQVAFGHVRALARWDGALWVGDDRGLTRVRGTAVRTFTTADGLPADRVQALTVAGGVLWVGTEGGAAHLEVGAAGVATGGVTPFTARDGLLENMVNAVAVDPAGGRWFGSYVAPRGGVTYFGPDGKRSAFTTSDGLPHADVTCITPMPGGEVWVGLGFNDRGGLAVFDASGPRPRIVRTLSKSDGLPGEKVRSITRLADGTILIGSEYDGMLIRAATGDRVLTTADGLADDEVKVAVQSSDGSVWLGTRNGITLMRDVAALMRR